MSYYRVHKRKQLWEQFTSAYDGNNNSEKVFKRRYQNIIYIQIILFISVYYITR